MHPRCMLHHCGANMQGVKWAMQGWFRFGDARRSRSQHVDEGSSVRCNTNGEWRMNKQMWLEAEPMDF